MQEAYLMIDSSEVEDISKGSINVSINVNNENKYGDKSRVKAIFAPDSKIVYLNENQNDKLASFPMDVDVFSKPFVIGLVYNRDLG